MEIGRWCFPSLHFMTLCLSPACSPTWTDSRRQLSSTGTGSKLKEAAELGRKWFLRGLYRSLQHGKTLPAL